MQRGARQRMYLAFQYHVFLYHHRSIRKIECHDFIEYNGSSVAAFSLENDKIFTNVIDNARQLFSASQQEENRAICFACKLIPQYLRKFTHHTHLRLPFYEHFYSLITPFQVAWGSETLLLYKMS